MKFEGSIKEILEFIELKQPEFADDLRTKMMGAIFELADSTELKKLVADVAESAANRKIQSIMNDALGTMLVLKRGSKGYIAQTPDTIEGWLADELKSKLGGIMANMDVTQAAIKSAVDAVAMHELDLVKSQVTRTMSRAETLVNDAAMKAVRSSMAQEFKEQVAAEFKDMQLEGMVMEMVQKTIGKMIANGDLLLNVKGDAAHE